MSGNEEGTDRSRRTLVLALVIGALCLAFTAPITVVLLTRGPSMTKVPDLVEKSLGEARRLAGEAGLELEPDAQEPLSSEARIHSQDPEAGQEVARGSEVFVVVEDIPELSLDDGRGVGLEAVPGTDDGQGSSEEDGDAGAATVPPGDSHGGGTLVCLDPGHSGPGPASEIDPETGLDVADNSGASGERRAVFDLARRLQILLEQRGYHVLMTKTEVDDYVNIKERAEIGNITSLMVRLHFDQSLHAIIHPEEGQYKQGPGGRRIYVDPAVAAASEEAAIVMLPHLGTAGISRSVCDCGGTSRNSGPAFVGSVYSRVPVVLIENDPSLLLDNPAGTERVAVALSEAINAYLSR